MPTISSPVRSNRSPARYRQQRRQNNAALRNLPPPIQYQKLSESEAAELDQRMQTTYGWDSTPKKFQSFGVRGQVEGEDLVIQAATGSGKTAVVAGPHLWIKDGITLMIVPLLQLEDEMVSCLCHVLGS